MKPVPFWLNPFPFWLNPFPLYLLILVIFIPLGCGLTKGSTFRNVVEADGGITTEEVKPEEEAFSLEIEGLRINSDPWGAGVYINNRYRGETPLDITDLDAGSYKLELRKEGYYGHTTWIQYSGADQSYFYTLERIMGQLEVSVKPSDAQITMGETEIDEGANRVPVGSYLLTVRAFGFEQQEEVVTIRENETTRVTLALAPAALRIDEPELTRRVFNPDNSGVLGTTTFKFKVSTYSTGIVRVFDGNGIELVRIRLPRFTTWEQAFVWDGRSDTGEIQGNADYTVQLEATSEGDQKSVIHESLVIHEEIVTIDHSMTISYRSLWSGTAGLLYTPSADVLPSQSFQIATLLMGHTESIEGNVVFRAPLDLAFRAGLGFQMEIDIQTSIILENAETVPLLASGAFKYRFAQVGDVLELDSALTAKISYQANTGTDTFSNFTGFSVGIPTQVSFGPASFIVAPELILSPYIVTYDSSYDEELGANLWFYLRSGLLLDLGFLMAGFSVSVRTTPFSEGFAIDVPFQTGFEVHWMIPGTQLFLSLAVAAEIESTADWYVMAGGGIGFLY